MKIETKLITGSTVSAGSKIMYYYGLNTIIAPGQKRIQSSANYVSRTTGNGTRPIAHNALRVYQDLIFVASWANEGFAVWRINNDGTVTSIYYDQYPNGSYGYMMSLAIDEVNHLAYVGTYSSNGITEYDFSGALSGGTTVVKNTTYYIADGFDGDSPGYPYYGGLEIAGDYLYYAMYEIVHTVVRRFNTTSKTHSSITVTNKQRNMDDGNLFYDKAHDRIYIVGHTDGATWVVENASTAGATAFQVYPSTYGYYNRPMAAITDKNNTNLMWLGAAYWFLKVDASACLEGTTYAPDYVNVFDYILRNPYNFDTPTVIFEHPEKGSDQILVKSNNGWYRKGGWVDTENNIIVSIARCNGSYDYYESDNFWEDDYGPIYLPIWSANNTKYWVVSGYSYDGDTITIYSNDPYEIYESSSIKFGSLAFTDSSNIEAINLPGFDDMIYKPTSCTLNIFVSNNAGSTWEAYTPGAGMHEFSSVGNAFQLKLEFSNPVTKSAYIFGNTRIAVDLITELPADTARKQAALRLATKE